MSETARDVFKRCLRDHIAPTLRREGLRGSGTSYVLPNPSAWAQLGFQTDRTDQADVVDFTINLKVTQKEWWDQQRRDHSYVKDTAPVGVDSVTWDDRRLKESYYPRIPAANLFGEGRCQRIGPLIPGIEADHWWHLTEDNADEVVADVLQALLLWGIPWLRSALRSG